MNSYTHPAALKCDRLTYRYSGSENPALEDIDLTVEPGELVVLVGPSGCGKSTLLKLVAGLIEPDRGRLLMDGRDLLGVPTPQRGIGWVPQSYALFDRLSVAENIAFGLRMRRMPKAKRKARTQTMLELCQISELAGRAVEDLSGGQRQRVAIARALAVQPRILLLDEPLAALDPQLRSSLRNELVKLLRDSGVTTLFVTHDQSEALAIADRIAVLRAGRLEQYGHPQALWERPANPFVARFLSSADVVQGHQVSLDEVEVFPGSTAKVDPASLNGTAIKIALRPTDFQIDPAGQPVVVIASEYTGGQYLVRGQVPDGPQLSFFSKQPLQLGVTVPIRLRSEAKLAVIES